MPLAPGTRLGPYEIQSAIGAGGMGEVYKARDTRLDRSVAIKVLPAQVSADPDRRARFEREAKTIAALTHPHICTLYDVGEHDGSTFLVMEHLQGETLAERLTKGPLPLDQALTVATEIADALSAAHRQGVIHRDLKPGNVMLTKAGAKLLDFGLAKLTGHGEQPAAAHLASAPTQSTPLTGEGMIVGTLQYMAPEQLEGKPADARTDLWALGAILYEMVTGKRAFEGTSAVSLIGNIMNAEPPALATLQPLTPPDVDRLVRRCLAKQPEERWDTAHDVAEGLRWLRESGAVGPVPGVTLRRTPRRRLVAVAVFGLATALLGAGVTWLLRPTGLAPVAVARTWLDVRPAEELNAGGTHRATDPQMPTPGGSQRAFCWTPDGGALVFVGRRGGTQQLYVRALDRDEARPLAGTEGAQVPAVSPDGQWVAFWVWEGGALKKVPLAGGPAVPVASGVDYPPHGLTWGARETLYFGRDVNTSAIWKVQGGGELAQVTKLGETEVWHGLPCMLPGDRVLLYTAGKGQWTSGGEEVVAQTLATGARTVLLRDAADARYVPTGHLVFLRQGVLFAVPFDASTVTIQGTPAPVLDGVAQALTAPNTTDVSLAGQFAVASTGTLAWLPRGSAGSLPARALVAVDRQGHVSPLTAPVKSYGSRVRLAPGGRELVVSVRGVRELGLWTHDLVRGTVTPVLQDGEAACAIWTPDGQHLVFQWLKDGRHLLAWQRADGTAPPEVLAAGPLWPSSWTADGRQLAAANPDSDTLAIVTVERGRATVTPLPQAPKASWSPGFSPDGHWLAYTSDVSGREEVYVQPYPGPGPRVQVSIDGGFDPAWHKNGRTLFFVSPGTGAGRARMMEVDVQPGSPPRIGTPRPLFEFAGDLFADSVIVRAYDVTPDGQRFFVVQKRPAPPLPPVTHVNLVLNWFEELKAKVPVR